VTSRDGVVHTSPIQSHKDEIDRLRRELDFANERADDASRNKGSEVQSIMKKYNRQLNELEDSLRVCSVSVQRSLSILMVLLQSKQLQIEDLLAKLDGHKDELDRLREEKDQEIAIIQEGMDTTIQQLAEAQQVRTCSGTARLCSYSPNLESRTCRSSNGRANRYSHPR
jgi:cell division protein FtsL